MATQADSEGGPLLRLFRSDLFGVFHLVFHLFKSDKTGVHDYLCNLLYDKPENEVEFYLAQLCNLVVHRPDSSSLERFLIDRCARSPHFCVQVCWFLDAIALTNTVQHAARCDVLRCRFEAACINAQTRSSANLVMDDELPPLVPLEDLLREESSEVIVHRMLSDIFTQAIAYASGAPPPPPSPAPISSPRMALVSAGPAEADSTTAMHLSKAARCDYFNNEISFIHDLVSLSATLRSVPRELRNASLRNRLEQINARGMGGRVFVPIEPASAHSHHILRFLSDESACMTSRERVPFLIRMEVCAVSASGSVKSPVPHNQQQQQQQSASDEHLAQKSDLDESLLVFPVAAAFGESQAARTKRVAASSPDSSMPGWGLQAFIVKSGEDLRQELLMYQVVVQFQKIFQAARLPLWVWPYRTLVTGPDSGLIEVVPDAISIHSLKERTPNFVSLAQYYKDTYAGPDRLLLDAAKRHFVESMAAYSLICYIMQVKDRHNGNILITADGHIIHIDFGFILGQSPGGLGFETAPFKLSAELTELMDGTTSPLFQYFRGMFVSGFQALRKNADKIVSLVDMFKFCAGNLPCFAGGDSVMLNLRDRFVQEMPDDEFVQHANNLIYQSTHAWRTKQYDNYQWYTGGIR
eukprot:TRINITY_DN14567_c0_g1_i1.p1 TRINITY_DN14567_c0_g1~~TRINITY_DN14567_c0_g1_i1.p1  ORF type:complete len:639 (-),score=81.13 TRINITY_DN14567_c0_g1_i1:87-2003(-)